MSAPSHAARVLPLSREAASRPLPPTQAFTLIELLVVIGLIASLSFLFFGGLSGGGKERTLLSAQATVSNLITAARTKAPATNRKVRLLINVDPTKPERYLRYLVLQLAKQPGASPSDWTTFRAVSLASDVYVVPASLTGVVTDASEWKRVSEPDNNLVSDLFVNQMLVYRLEGDVGDEMWTGVAFTPNHTLAALGTGPPPKGFLLVAPGWRRSPGSYEEGEPPIELINPQRVRGLVLSAYGTPTLLDDHRAF